jgi:signal transduction histidine kinase
MAEQESLKEDQQTVLIVEDEHMLAEALSATLDIEGLRTIIVHDGLQALAMARKLHPDLILLDVMLPGKSGIEVCATLKTDPATSSIPVAIISARTEEADMSIGLAAGADVYVTKPFSPVKLIDLVKEMMAGGDVLSPPPPTKPSLSNMSADQLIVYARDLRELFQREHDERQELGSARQRLEELDTLKASFLSAVTHELMTPFAPIGLALQVLQRDNDNLTDDQRESLDDLTTEIAGLHRMVSGVVKFAGLVNKRRDPQPGHISIDGVVPWAVQPVAVLAQARQVDFRVFVAADLPKVHADPDLLGEAVFQMAHNAVKFTPPGGSAEVKVDASEDRMTITVTDTGVGMTPEQLDGLGEPFEQSADALRRGKEGLGIGWTFVRYVAEIHGGETNVESPGPDQGSTFTLALPLAEGDIAERPDSN